MRGVLFYGLAKGGAYSGFALLGFLRMHPLLSRARKQRKARQEAAQQSSGKAPLDTDQPTPWGPGFKLPRAQSTHLRPALLAGPVQGVHPAAIAQPIADQVLVAWFSQEVAAGAKSSFAGSCSSWRGCGAPRWLAWLPQSQFWGGVLAIHFAVKVRVEIKAAPKAAERKPNPHRRRS